MFLGLNPVLLVLAVGGAHNDTLLIMALALALLLTAAPRPRPRAAAVALAGGVGVKLTAALVLPFLVLCRAGAGERACRSRRPPRSACSPWRRSGVVGFGPHALGFLTAIGEQQQLVATHSMPAETARLVGLTGTPAWWRDLWVAGFVVAIRLRALADRARRRLARSRRAGRRSRCCSPRPGCCRGMRSGRCR